MNGSQKTRRSFFADTVAASSLLLGACSRSARPRVPERKGPRLTVPPMSRCESVLCWPILPRIIPSARSDTTAQFPDRSSAFAKASL